jgi:hypothetical protein
MQLYPLAENKRLPEADVFAAFEADLPAIQRGLFDLVAAVLAALPTVTIVNPGRMIEFVAWLAAMEIVDGVAAGTYQSAYGAVVQQGQRDSLLNHPLAAALLEFGEHHIGRMWSGTPAQLLEKLNEDASAGTQRSRGWPQNPIALSKKLGSLQAALLAQGIRLEFHRGKHRTISIKGTAR